MIKAVILIWMGFDQYRTDSLSMLGRDFKERYGIDLDYEVYKPCIGSTRLHFMNLIKEDYGITFESLEVMNQIMKEKKDEIIARDGFPEMRELSRCFAV